MRVVILGASDKPGRYSFRAFQLLRQLDHVVIPVSLRLQQLEGVPVVRTLAQIPNLESEPPHTLTIYLNPEHSNRIVDQIMQLPVQRVIFNPGSENKLLADRLVAEGREVTESCTLIMLRAGIF